MSAVIFKTEQEMTNKLQQFGVSLDDLIKIVRSVVTAHFDAVPNDPCTASGQFKYIYGTRALRDLFCGNGWVSDREHGIESVFNPENGTKVIYQSVDLACNDFREPKAISRKGNASQSLIERSMTGYLFSEMEDDYQKKTNATTWFLCVSINNDVVRAELSLPHSVENNNFGGFIERIYLVQQGDWADDGIIDIDDNEELLEFEPKISKK